MGPIPRQASIPVLWTVLKAVSPAISAVTRKLFFPILSAYSWMAFVKNRRGPSPMLLRVRDVRGS
jgi:hypothetical protein